MCGRFTLRSTSDQIAAVFGLGSVPDLPPRYNIAPTQEIAAVRREKDADYREFVSLRWGLVPFWADDLKIGNRMINARAESLATKPSFRQAFAKRRCLIVADGFYEWQKLAANKKQPYYIHFPDNRPFAFAGLWESWQGDDGEVQTCCIITTEANDLMQPLHDRMPVILGTADYDQWLDPKQKAATLEPLLKPCPSEWLEAYPVSTLVNSPRNDVPECLDPAQA